MKMKENGFEDANLWRVKPAMSWVKFNTDCPTMSFAEMASKMSE